MRAEYMQEPPSVEIETLDGMANVILRTNIATTTREDDPDREIYMCDEYYVPAVYRENLKADVESHFDAWLEVATQSETSTPTIEQRVEAVESEVATVAEVVEALFGGVE